MPKSVQLKNLILALLALWLLCGCGYAPVVLRGPMADANGVNVTLFVNKSYRPGIEGMLARNLVDEFALRTGGRVLPGDQAQLELSGVILSYSSLAVSYTASDTIKEYKAQLSVQATLREKQTQKVLWRGDLSEEQSYPVSTNIALQQNAEEAALAKVCHRLSEQVWQKIGERF